MAAYATLLIVDAIGINRYLLESKPFLETAMTKPVIFDGMVITAKNQGKLRQITNLIMTYCNTTGTA